MMTILEALEKCPYPVTDESRNYHKMAAALAHYLRANGTPVFIHRHQAQVPKDFLDKFLARFNLPVTWTFERVFYDVDDNKQGEIKRYNCLMIVDNRIIVVPSEERMIGRKESLYDYYFAFVGEDATQEMQEWLAQEVAEALRNLTVPDVDRIGILQEGQRGIEIATLNLPAVQFKPDNYSKEINEWWDYLNDSIEKDKKMKGKLSILQGPPGCGKTMFLRSMLYKFRTNAKSKFIYVPLHTAKSLSSPAFVPVLNAWSQRKIVLVVEDADMLLGKRTKGGDGLISEFLNLTDGILGAALNLHVVVTTNLPKTEFDPAITRPGRLHSLLQFDLLPKEQAAMVYKRECGKDLVTDKDKLSLAEIYAMAAEEDNGAEAKKAQQTGQYL